MMCQSEAELSSLLSSADPPAPVPLYFGPPARRLFGWYYAPAPQAARNRAVVLCAPLGHEALHTHAAYRYVAEQLAAAGFPTLRFDYDGTGDSAGGDKDESRVGQWLASIGFAVDTLRQHCGTEAVSLFGVRMGATLAAVAAAERGDIAELLLWAPCRSGRLWRRELRVLQAAHGPQEGSELGSEEAGGFVYTRSTGEALDQLDAAGLIGRPAEAVLLVGRDDLPEDTRLARSLAALGATVTAETWPGYAAMMRDAQDTEIPVSAIRSLADWLIARTAPAPVSAAVPPNAGRLTAADYTEEAVFWNSDACRFGILTRPCEEGPREQSAIVLLNVGANSHIGPNRMWVTLARQLAALGFPVLRLDTAGLGDSATGPASARQQLYSNKTVPDVQAALSYLEACTGAGQFTLIGLCSGAYTACLTAYEDPRVCGQILINSQALDWKEGDTLDVLLRQSYKPTQTYVSSLRDPEVWKRVLHSQVDVRGIMRAVGQRLAVRGQAILRSLPSLALRQAPAETPAGSRLRAAAERGVDTLFLFAAEDAGLELTLLHLGTTARRLLRLPGTHLSVIHAADHTFTAETARREMLALVTRHLQARFPAA